VTLHSVPTANFVLQYDDAIFAEVDGDALIAALAAICEADFTTLMGVFGGTRPTTPITVTIIQVPRFGGSNNGQDMSIGYGGAGAASATFFYLYNAFIAELAEVFMDAQGKWNPGDSKGEALSRALGGLKYPRGQQPGFTVHQWVDNDPDYNNPTFDAQALPLVSGRQDWVSKTFPSDNPAKSTGCGIAFLYYLHAQLGFSWARIVSVPGSTLEDVYAGLAGSSKGFLEMMAAVDREFPPGQKSGLNGSDVSPFSDGFEQNATPAKLHPRALVSPNGTNEVPLSTDARLSTRKYLTAAGLQGAVNLRPLAIDAARPKGSARLHDSLSQVGMRGLLNSRRAAARF
jgi:hypothetical protein